MSGTSTLAKRDDPKRRLGFECVERADYKRALVGYRGALVKKPQKRGAGMGTVGSSPPGHPQGSRLSPGLSSSPYPTNHCGCCLFRSWGRRQPHYCLRHRRFSRLATPPPPSCLPPCLPPLRLVQSRLAKAAHVMRRAEPIGIRSSGC